jgi:hypothetical protein
MSDIQDNKPLLTPKQVAQKGEQIYQEKLKPILEPKENGRFVTVEVNSGEYFLGDSLLETLQHAHQKYPDRLFRTIKVGAEGVFKMGTYGKHLSYGWKS